MPGQGVRRYPAPRRALASSYLAANSQFLSVASNATLQMGASVDMTLAGWVYLKDTAASGYNIFTKSNPSGSNFEYYLEKTFANPGFWQFGVSANGSTFTTTDALVAAAANVWHFVCARYDGANMSLSINNGSFSDRAFTTDIFVGTNRFAFGSNDLGGNFMNGILDNWGLWKSARGSGGALTNSQVAYLWNNGHGVRFEEWTAALRAPLVSAWPFDGNFTDQFGTNTLVNNAGVTFAPGIR
jgi:hypothetical protein